MQERIIDAYLSQPLADKPELPTDQFDSSVKPAVATPDPRRLVRDRKTQKMFDHGNEQMKLYEPCECGSGKKFKWCCKDKVAAPPIEDDSNITVKDDKIIIDTNA